MTKPINMWQNTYSTACHSNVTIDINGDSHKMEKPKRIVLMQNYAKVSRESQATVIDIKFSCTSSENRKYRLLCDITVTHFHVTWLVRE